MNGSATIQTKRSQATGNLAGRQRSAAVAGKISQHIRSSIKGSQEQASKPGGTSARTNLKQGGTPNLVAKDAKNSARSGVGAPQLIRENRSVVAKTRDVSGSGGSAGRHSGRNWNGSGVPSAGVGLKNTSGVKRAVTMRLDGTEVAMAPIIYHASMNAYKRDVPLATAHMFGGTGAAAHEHMEKDGRHTTMKGREFLGVIGFLGTTMAPNTIGNDTVGSMSSGGPWLLTPEAIGGRMLLLSQDYEEIRMKKVRVIYVPSVPATEPGSLALAFTADIATNGYLSGIAAVAHSASGAFASGNVFEELSLDIAPQDVLKRYFDSTTGEFTLETQGRIDVLNIGGLVVPSGELKIYGDLYLEYEADFFSPKLDTEISLIPSGTGTITFSSTSATNESYPATFSTLAGVAAPQFSYDTLMPTDLQGYMMVFTVIEHDWTTTAGKTAPNWMTYEGELVHSFLPGFVFYGRHYRVGTVPDYYLALYADPVSAAGGEYLPGSGMDVGTGSIIWAQTIAAAACYYGTVTLSYRAIALEDD